MLLRRLSSDVDDDKNVGLAFGLVIFAGLSTTLGGLPIFWDRMFGKREFRVLGAALGFSSGVMFYISFTEIFAESIHEFQACECLWEDEPGEEGPAYLLTTLCFFGGVILVYLLDFAVHKLYSKFGIDHTHEINDIPEMTDRDNIKSPQPDTEFAVKDEETKKKVEEPEVPKEANGMKNETETYEDDSRIKLLNMGLVTAVAISLHNFPEGLATFAATLADPNLGVAFAIAIALHNIPEGLCVAAPIYYATGNKVKALVVAFLSGLTEVFGALLGYLFLNSVFGPVAYGILFGLISGMMVTIVLKELLPTAHRYDREDKYVTVSVLLGFAVMASSLVLFVV